MKDILNEVMDSLHEEKKDVRSGFINCQWTMWCSSCVNWDTVSFSKKSLAIKEFKIMGWRKTKSGWTCPQCLKNKMK